MADNQQREAVEAVIYGVLTDDASEGLDLFDLAVKIASTLTPVQPDPLRAGVEALTRFRFFQTEGDFVALDDLRPVAETGVARGE